VEDSPAHRKAYHSQANDTLPDRLRNTILNCKRHRAVQEYGEAAVIFLISRVGDSPSAKEFLDQLEKDPEVGNMVFCSPERLDERLEALRRNGDDREYTAYVSTLHHPNPSH
jgi:hypothetical protein